MFSKDPSAVLDYVVDLSAWLPEGDTVAAADWSVDPVSYVGVPTNLVSAEYTSGGTLTADTYYYVVTAINAQGETTPSDESASTITGSTGMIILGWDTVDNATGYRVYRGTSTGNEDLLVGTVTDGTVGAFTDTGLAGTSATVPDTNTAIDSLAVQTSPAPSLTDTTATVWLAEGLIGDCYTLASHITTAAGRQNTWYLSFTILEVTI